ncbi:MAG TPA: cytochrome D1 domain-containing protein [Thermoanaerobaculia bacterium]|jgi:YVTN family beta-propeller protein|nr:cytochrome D1 domain-containing protein [Thermoanaerobaculia bacterium]
MPIRLFLFTLLLASSVRPLHAATLIVANKSEATVSLVDLGSGKVAATLPVGTGPHEVAVSRNGRLALIANYGTAETQGSTLTLIDVPGAKVVKTIDLGEYKKPHGMVWIGDSRALVTSEASKALLEVDVETGKVVRALTTGQDISHMVAVTPDGSRAFVANIGSGGITAFDLKEGKKLADVPTAAGSEGITVTPDGKQVWVTNRAADSVTVLDTATLKTVKTFDAPAFPIRAEATPDGKRVLVSLAKSGDVAVFSTSTLTLERRIPLEAPPAADRGGRLLADFGNSSVPIGIEIAPDGKRAYVAHANADQISIVDLAEWKKVGSLTAGKEPDGMGMSALDVKPSK